MPIIVDSSGGNPATVADLEARWRPLSDQETTNADAFLVDAWSYLIDRRPTLPDDMSAGVVSQGNVLRVICAMVLRVLKNPEGWAEEGVDDWRGKRATALAAGELYATPAELADITPGRATRKSVRLVANGDS